MKKVTVADLLKVKSTVLGLQLISGQEGLGRTIKSGEAHRPVMVFRGLKGSLREQEVQVLGREERDALKTAGSRTKVFKKIFSSRVPCFIITAGVRFSGDFMEKAACSRIPVLKTTLNTTRFISRLSVYLDDRMSLRSTIQGVMMDVYGIGVLIRGVSGIGKSECALELLKRGHRIISDDIVGVKQRSGNILIAYSMGIKRHYVEVRGLGIIDIENIFGIGSVRNAIRIELVVRLEDWDRKKEYDRLGTEQRFLNILGVSIPEVVIPVTSGRNLAVIVELAAKNHRLKEAGHYAARELDEQLIKITRKKD